LYDSIYLEKIPKNERKESKIIHGFKNSIKIDEFIDSKKAEEPHALPKFNLAMVFRQKMI